MNQSTMKTLQVQIKKDGKIHQIEFTPYYKEEALELLKVFSSENDEAKIREIVDKTLKERVVSPLFLYLVMDL